MFDINDNTIHLAANSDEKNDDGTVEWKKIKADKNN